MGTIGLIREAYGDGYPNLADCISSAPIENKGKVLMYLKRAPVVGAAAGRAVDYMTGKRIPQEFLFYDDGEFNWRSDTIYFFEKYNLRLPDAFIKKAISNIANVMKS